MKAARCKEKYCNSEGGKGDQIKDQRMPHEGYIAL
jgi:hypothetical protein